jgi:hypothetical protein
MYIAICVSLNLIYGWLLAWLLLQQLATVFFCKTDCKVCPFPPLPLYCSSYRGYSAPLPPAAARAILSPSSRHSSLSCQMQGVTVDAPSLASRGRSRPRQTPETSRSTSLCLDASAEGRFFPATRRRICRRQVESTPAPLGCAEDEVDVVSTQSRSRAKTKRGQIRFRRGSSRPIRWVSSPTIDGYLGSRQRRFDSTCCGPNLPFFRYHHRLARIIIKCFTNVFEHHSFSSITQV